MTWEYNSYLAHYGIKGQKWGVRQWQNEDGSYTEAGKHRYGWGYGRQTSGYNSGINSEMSSRGTRPQSSIRTRTGQRNQLRSGVRTVLNQPPQKYHSTPEEIEARKARTRKIITAVAGLAITALAGYALYKHHKSSRNLIQIAKNRIYDNYNQSAKSLTGAELQKNRYWQQKDMNSITSRRDARKVFGLKMGKQTKQFIKNNRLGKVSTASLMEYRTGPLVEGYRKTMFGNFKKVSGLRLRRERNRVARRLLI